MDELGAVPHAAGAAYHVESAQGQGVNSRIPKLQVGGSNSPGPSTFLHMPPSFGNGKICYIEIPATDIARSADFYHRVFGWNTRKRGDGSTAFDDAVGQVSGTWVLGRPPASAPGLLVYVMVDSVAAALDLIVANGGEIVQPIGVDAPEITAWFRDPAGNVIGLYQQPA
jgi:uncharacterized protein